MSRRRPPPGLVAVATVIGLAFAAPMAYIVWRNVELGGDVLATVLSDRTLPPLVRSIVLAASVSLTCAAVGTGLAWAVNRTDLPGRRLWQVLSPLPLVFPSFVGAAALLTAFAPGGLAERLLEPLGIEWLPKLEGFWAAWLVLVLFTYPLVYLPVAARLRTLPASLEESALLLGRPPREVFRTVVLPQISVAVGAGSLLVFLYTLSDFGVVQLMRYGTLTREIYLSQPGDLTTAFALALLLGVLAIAVVVVERLVGRRRLETVAVRSTRPLTVSLRAWRWPALALVVVFLANALVAPVLALGWWAWRGLDASGDPAGWLSTELGDLVQPTLNTAGVSLVAAAVGVLVVLPVAYLTTRYRSRAGAATNAFVVGGFALPGLAIALSLVFWSLNAPLLDRLYQTFALLVFAYVVHFGAQAMGASQLAVASLPTRLEDAARMLGAGRIRRFLSIELPLMAPGLLAGAGLVLLSTMKELPATLLLAPTGFRTLATQTWVALEGGFLSDVGLTALVLVGLSAVLTWVLVVRRSDALA